MALRPEDVKGISARRVTALRVLLAAASAVGGIGLTMLLAWRCSTGTVIGSYMTSYVLRPREPQDGEGEGSLSARRYGKPGQVRWITIAASAGARVDGGHRAGKPEALVPSGLADQLLPWCNGGRPWPPSGERESVYVIGGGWPLPALYSVRREDRKGASWSNVLVLPGTSQRALKSGNIPPGFPTGTLWRGLFVDSLVLASLPWLAAWLWLRSRAGFRRERNHCVRCGYDLAGIAAGVCPECGVGVLRQSEGVKGALKV